MLPGSAYTRTAANCGCIAGVRAAAAAVGAVCCQVVRLKTDFQARIREAEALKLELGRAEATLAAASGEGLGCSSVSFVQCSGIGYSVHGLTAYWYARCSACLSNCSYLHNHKEA